MRNDLYRAACVEVPVGKENETYSPAVTALSWFIATSLQKKKNESLTIAVLATVEVWHVV
jgi:hypothetical protein